MRRDFRLSGGLAVFNGLRCCFCEFVDERDRPGNGLRALSPACVEHQVAGDRRGLDVEAVGAIFVGVPAGEGVALARRVLDGNKLAVFNLLRRVVFLAVFESNVPCQRRVCVQHIDQNAARAGNECVHILALLSSYAEQILLTSLKLQCLCIERELAVLVDGTGLRPVGHIAACQLRGFDVVDVQTADNNMIRCVRGRVMAIGTIERQIDGCVRLHLRLNHRLVQFVAHMMVACPLIVVEGPVGVHHHGEDVAVAHQDLICGRAPAFGRQRVDIVHVVVEVHVVCPEVLDQDRTDCAGSCNAKNIGAHQLLVIQIALTGLVRAHAEVFTLGHPDQQMQRGDLAVGCGAAARDQLGAAHRVVRISRAVGLGLEVIAFEMVGLQIEVRNRNLLIGHDIAAAFGGDILVVIRQREVDGRGRVLADDYGLAAGLCAARGVGDHAVVEAHTGLSAGIRRVGRLGCVLNCRARFGFVFRQTVVPLIGELLAGRHDGQLFRLLADLIVRHIVVRHILRAFLDGVRIEAVAFWGRRSGKNHSRAAEIADVIFACRTSCIDLFVNAGLKRMAQFLVADTEPAMPVLARFGACGDAAVCFCCLGALRFLSDKGVAAVRADGGSSVPAVCYPLAILIVLLASRRVGCLSVLVLAADLAADRAELVLAFGRAALNFSLREHRKAVLAADSLGMVEAVFIHTRNTAVLGMHVRAFCDLLPHECRSLAGVDLVVCVAVRGIQILRNRTQFIQRNDIVEVLLILVFLIVVQANALRAEHRRFQRITVLNGAENAAAALTAKRTGRFTVRTGHVADAVAVIDMAAANPPGQTADVFAAGDAAGIVAVVEVRLIRIAGQTADIIRAAELACVIAVRHLRAAPAIADQTAGARTGAGDSAFVAAVSDRDVVFAVVRYRAAVIADQTAGFTRAGHRTNVPAALNVGVPAAGQHHTHKTAGSDAGYAAGWGVDDRHIRGNAAERAETAQIRCRRANAEALCRLTFNLDLAFERQIANNRNVVLVLAADRAEQAKTLALLRHILHVKVQAGDGLAVAIEDTGKAVFARADGRPRLRQGDIVHQLALDVGFASVDLITEPLELCLVRDLVAAVRVLLRYARVYHWELIAAHAGAVALVGAILSLCLTNRLAAVLADCRDGVRAVVLALVFGFCMLVLAFRFFHFCIGHPCQDGKTGFLALLESAAEGRENLRILHVCNDLYAVCANRVRGCEAVLKRAAERARRFADCRGIFDRCSVVRLGDQAADRAAADDLADVYAVFNCSLAAPRRNRAQAADMCLCAALRSQLAIVRAVLDRNAIAVASQTADRAGVARAVGHGHIDVGCNLFQRHTAVALSNDAASINRHIAARRSRRGNRALDDQLLDRRILRHAEQCSRVTRSFCNVQAGNGFLVAVKNAGERLVVI